MAFTLTKKREALWLLDKAPLYHGERRKEYLRQLQIRLNNPQGKRA